MQNVFFQAICRTGIFMICAQAIVHFRPRETYEKYLKLLVSIMTLIQLFLPVGSFFWGDGGQETARALEQFKSDFEKNMRQAEDNARQADELLRQMTLEEVRRQAQQGARQVTGSSGSTSSPGESAPSPGESASSPGGSVPSPGESASSPGGSAPSPGAGGPASGGADGNGTKIEVRVEVESVEPVGVIGAGREE